MKTEENIDAIVIHCSATPEGKNVTLEDIDRMHRQKGWKMVGYNYVIELDGTVRKGRPLTMAGAHCNTAGLSGKSYNLHSIGICYVGGVEGERNAKGQIVEKKDKNGKAIAKDTRTPEQKNALATLLKELHEKYPNAQLYGHRELVCSLKKSNPHYDCTRCKGYPSFCRDAKKSCPSFDVHEYDYIFNDKSQKK